MIATPFFAGELGSAGLRTSQRFARPDVGEDAAPLRWASIFAAPGSWWWSASRWAVGAAVAVAGSVGFIGLGAPHLGTARGRLRPDARTACRQR